MLLTAVLLSALASPGLCSAPDASALRAGRASGALLWLASLSDSERETMLDGMERLAVRIEARFHPLVHDFDEEPLRLTTERFLARYLPRFNAAESLAAGRWRSAGTWYSLERSARCRRLDALDPAVRFAAWPVGYAAVLRASGGRAGSVADLLREGLPDRWTGAVISGADGPPAELLRLAGAARRIQKRVRRLSPDLARQLDALTALDRPGPDPLLVAPDEVWVVPKLSALPSEPMLRAAVAGLVWEEPVVWLSPPP